MKTETIPAANTDTENTAPGSSLKKVVFLLGTYLYMHKNITINTQGKSNALLCSMAVNVFATLGRNNPIIETNLSPKTISTSVRSMLNKNISV